MRKYQCTKQVYAEPMMRFTAQDLGLIRDTTDVNEPGYHVVYSHDYASWSPKASFEEGYHEIEDYSNESNESDEQETLKSTEMSFGEALTAIQNGLKVARHGWNGKGMYLVYFSPLEHGFADAFEIRGEMKPLLPFIVMKTADDMYVPWLASQADMLSNDWEIL